MNISTLKETSQTEHKSAENYDRIKDLKSFEETKSGVKGLVDAGIEKVPQIFIRPPDELANESNTVGSDQQVPVIDLTEIESDEQRKKIVKEVKRASKEWGFFQVVNHGIPVNVLEGMLEGIGKFHEQDAEVKMQFHSREMTRKVKYSSNIDLYRSRVANWRDSLTISLMSLDHLEPEELPEICRDSTMEYLNHVTKLGQTLFELLSESLGLKPDYLGSMGSGKGHTSIGHYYPPCPEPHLTIGTSKHTDPSFITILLQDQIGGLQVLHDNHYVNVPPLPGSLVVNIGDMLQIMSNDEFISTDHRVLSKQMGPRISVAGFFTGDSLTEKIYGPIKELISEESQPLYKEFTVREYISKFFDRPIDKSGLDDFKLQG